MLSLGAACLAAYVFFVLTYAFTFHSAGTQIQILKVSTVITPDGTKRHLLFDVKFKGRQVR